MVAKTRKTILSYIVATLCVATLACSVSPYYPVPTVPSPYDVYVTTTGNDARTCRTLALACRTVTGGVAKAVAGSNVIIGAGTFVESGVVQMSSPMTLRGAGRTRTIISSRGNRVFYLVSSSGYPAEVHMQDLAIANLAAAVGVAVVNQSSTLVMTRVTIRNNALDGLQNFGTAMLTDCEISDNGGQGISSDATLQVTDSIFRRNAHAAITNSGVAVIQGTTLELNGSDAIYNGRQGDHPGTLTVERSNISNNAGVGLINNGGHVTISASTIDTNAGGGLLNTDGVLLLGTSEVAHNLAHGLVTEDTSPPLNAVAEITQTAFIMNTRGAVYLGGGVARLTNVTMSGNTVGIEIAHGNLTLAYSTVAYNTLWGVKPDNTDASAVLQNSIVALNAPGQDCVAGSTGQIVQDSASLACDATLTNVRLLLGVLDLSNGTQIHPLLAGSPAIDTATGACPGQDQRQYSRPYGRACDVGAYEFGAGLHLEVATPGIVELLPSDTPTPGIIIFLLDKGKNANCRNGPGNVYTVLTSLTAGQSAQAIGRNEDGSWLYALIPGDFRCWMLASSGTPNGDVMGLPVQAAPPTPTPTITPKPGGGGGIDFDGDGYNSDKDCDDKNAKVHPGAPETAKDGVDSNCNGKDDS